MVQTNAADTTAFRMLVFRSGRRTEALSRLRDHVERAICALTAKSEEHAIDALIRSGELECGLADAGHPSAKLVAWITDACAQVLIDERPMAPAVRGEACRRLAVLRGPDTLTVSPALGYAYRGLHPGDFAVAALRLQLRTAAVAVLGIRTIGVTLAAIVGAALRSSGAWVERRTVRPEGHPSDRRTVLDESDQAWARRWVGGGADFLVVDEGPGISGSSILSVVDALLAADVPRQRIHVLCSHIPDPARLRARDAARRWSALDVHAADPDAGRPSRALRPVGAGQWRAHIVRHEQDWPASWIEMERPKYLSTDGSTLFKFEGLGPYGAAALMRARALSESGLVPTPADHGHGFFAYQVENSSILAAGDLHTGVLDRMARYCAVRRANLAVPRIAPGALEEMARHNFEQETGLPLASWPELEVRHPVVPDGRMMPHEWHRRADGRLVKFDALTHGDDQFYPGPTDIAWDLAGTIVEWRLSGAARKIFLDRYRRYSGDNPAGRLWGYLFAYTVFRLGYTRMAAAATGSPQEARRLRAEYRRYRSMLVGTARARHDGESQLVLSA